MTDFAFPPLKSDSCEPMKPEQSARILTPAEIVSNRKLLGFAAALMAVIANSSRATTEQQGAPK